MVLHAFFDHIHIICIVFFYCHWLHIIRNNLKNEQNIILIFQLKRPLRQEQILHFEFNKAVTSSAVQLPITNNSKRYVES